MFLWMDIISSLAGTTSPESFHTKTNKQANNQTRTKAAKSDTWQRLGDPENFFGGEKS